VWHAGGVRGARRRCCRCCALSKRVVMAQPSRVRCPPLARVLLIVCLFVVPAESQTCPKKCGPLGNLLTCDELAGRMPPGIATCEMLTQQCGDCTGCMLCEEQPTTAQFTGVTTLPSCIGYCGEGACAPRLRACA
jgi:hypothetical protein